MALNNQFSSFRYMLSFLSLETRSADKTQPGGITRELEKGTEAIINRERRESVNAGNKLARNTRTGWTRGIGRNAIHLRAFIVLRRFRKTEAGTINFRDKHGRSSRPRGDPPREIRGRELHGFALMKLIKGRSLKDGGQANREKNSKEKRKTELAPGGERTSLPNDDSSSVYLQDEASVVMGKKRASATKQWRTNERPREDATTFQSRVLSTSSKNRGTNGKVFLSADRTASPANNWKIATITYECWNVERDDGRNGSLSLFDRAEV